MTRLDNIERDKIEVAAIGNMIAPPGRVLELPPNLTKARAGHDGMARLFPILEGTVCAPCILGGIAGERISPPTQATDQAILYFHGWGHALGSIVSHRHLAAQLAAASHATGYIIDYRLAPEAPFPAAIDDGVSAYLALIDAGYRAQNIVLVGDSSGGGLALSVALKLKKTGYPRPAGLFLMSPWVDLSLSGASHDLKGDVDFMCNSGELAHWAGLYLGNTPAADPVASPINADLCGLPPLLIHVGSEEILLSDGVKLAENAGIAGVEVTLMIGAHMPHGWHYLWPFVTKARDAISQAGSWIAARSLATSLLMPSTDP